jgi:hypothetical protein
MCISSVFIFVYTLDNNIGFIQSLAVGNPEIKRLLGRPKHRWECNFKMDIEEGGWEDMDWITVAEERDKYLALVNTVVNMWLTQNAWNLLTR